MHGVRFKEVTKKEHKQYCVSCGKLFKTTSTFVSKCGNCFTLRKPTTIIF